MCLSYNKWQFIAHFRYSIKREKLLNMKNGGGTVPDVSACHLIRSGNEGFLELSLSHPRFDICLHAVIQSCSHGQKLPVDKFAVAV